MDLARTFLDSCVSLQSLQNGLISLEFARMDDDFALVFLGPVNSTYNLIQSNTQPVPLWSLTLVDEFGPFTVASRKSTLFMSSTQAENELVLHWDYISFQPSHLNVTLTITLLPSMHFFDYV